MLPRGQTNESLAMAQGNALLSSKQTLFIFWCLTILIIGDWLRYVGDYGGGSQAGYLLIAAAALLPIGLWASGKVPGMPIFPAFAIFQFLAFGMPLLSKHPGITFYSADVHWEAAITIAVSLTAGTWGWLLMGSRARQAPTHCLQLAQISGDRVLLFTIILSLFMNANTVFEWVNIPSGLFSLIRGVVGGVSTIALFVLGQHMGMNKLTKGIKITFIIVVIFFFFVQIMTLLLVNALTVAILALGGYTLGSRRPPWLATIALVAVISFLHIGKAPVRETFWGENRESHVHTFSEAVDLFDFWIDSSTEALAEGRTVQEEEEKKATAFQRVSLMHLFLMEKTLLENGYTHMNGETYWIIPPLLVPRFLNPDKGWSQEGTTLLNIHFNLQDRESSMTTTIGWGLVNEGYANFGLLGSAGICFLVGIVSGSISRMSQGLPFLSFRSLVAILFLSSTFQTESSLSVLTTTLFQSFIGLAAFSFVFMKKLPINELVQLIEVVPRKKKGQRGAPV